MARKPTIMVVIVGCWILSVGYGLGAELKKARTDLTGRENLTPEEVIEGLTPPDPQVRTRGVNPATRGLRPGLATIAVTVHFAFDSSEILPQAEVNLRSLGQALQSPQLAAYQIRIEGHTDSTGPAAYNMGLSHRRANSVKQYLVQHFDIDAERLLTDGRGEDEPITSNHMRDGRRKNRQAEFINMGEAVSSR
jgi:outer membrane protein OmpA-like peptidoglycan-associated protein